MLDRIPLRVFRAGSLLFLIVGCSGGGGCATDTLGSSREPPPAVARVEVGEQAIIYEGGGEANDVRLIEYASTDEDEDGYDDARVRIRDEAANLEAGVGCVAVDPHEVRCEGEIFVLVDDSPTVVVRLGGGDDRFSAQGVCRDSRDYYFGCGLDVAGGEGDDVVVGSEALDDISGGPGDDSMDGRAGAQSYRGTTYGDKLRGGSGTDIVRGGLGPDELVGGLGADRLAGGPGSDFVSYAGRRDALTVDLDGAADDGARGEMDAVGTDVEGIVGGRGADTLTGNGGANEIQGGPGDDLVRGGRGRDRLMGNGGMDRLRGGADADEIFGGGWSVQGVELPDGLNARDSLLGASGNDGFYAFRGGRDRLRGGPGRDRAFADRTDDIRGVERIN